MRSPIGVVVAGMSDVRGTIWSTSEVDLIVADYFKMLADELAGRSYIKAHHNKALQDLTGRDRGSIERKHQNISAVLEKLGLPFIRGYKPLPHFQNILLESVERTLSVEGAPVLAFSESARSAVAESATLWIGPPPEISRSDKDEPEHLRRLVRKFDPALRDAQNRQLGKQGEELVFLYERERLKAAQREDLAVKVEWTSEVRGDGAGYDIHSFEPDGRERLIEVKTSQDALLPVGERAGVQF